MKTTAKTTALALVLAMMVSIICASVSVSADGPVNLAAGRPYTLSCDDIDKEPEGWINKGAPDTDPPSQLTDGKVRGAFQLTAGGDPVRKISVEFAGTYRTFIIDVSLEGASTVNSVKLDNVRRGNNRYLNVVKLEAKVGGAWQNVAFTETKVTVPESQQYADEEHGVPAADQFFNVEEVFAAPVANVTNVRISFDTNFAGKVGYPMFDVKNTQRAYIAQLDEIEVMGTKGGAAPPAPPASEAAPPAPPASQGEGPAPAASGETPPIADTSTGPVEPPTVPTGDAGIAVFALLAIISGAAAVILRKKG